MMCSYRTDIAVFVLLVYITSLPLILRHFGAKLERFCFLRLKASFVTGLELSRLSKVGSFKWKEVMFCIHSPYQSRPLSPRFLNTPRCAAWLLFFNGVFPSFFLVCDFGAYCGHCSQNAALGRAKYICVLRSWSRHIGGFS